MSLQTEIRKALEAHDLWKARLNHAIETGKAFPSPAQAAVDHACDFGKWLYALPVAQTRDPHYSRARALHAHFHVEAAAVLRLVEAGRTPEAKLAVTADSPFGRATTQLVASLQEWASEA